MNASSHSYNPVSGGGYDPVSNLRISSLNRAVISNKHIRSSIKLDKTNNTQQCITR